MVRYSLRSIVAQRSQHIASAVIFAAGTALLSACAALLNTGLYATSDRGLLIQFPVIIGGWSLAVVVYAVVSTVGVRIEGRSEELASLSMIGATRRQLASMVATETAVVGAAAAVPGSLLGLFLGSEVLGRLIAIGRVDSSTTFTPGFVSILVAALVVVGASSSAAFVRLLRRDSRSTSAGRLRVAAAGVCAVLGLGSSSTVFALDPDGIHSTAAAGPGVVLLAIAASLVAPEALTVTRRVVAGLFGRFGGVGGFLANTTMKAAPERVRPVAAFATLFVGVTVGTLTMQGIENARATDASAQQELMGSINYSVVAAVAAFLAIATTNNMIGSIRARAGEFSSMTSLGAQRDQTIGMLSLEALSACVTAAFMGTASAAVAVAPFAYVKTENPWLAVSPVVCAVTLAATGLFTVGAARMIGGRVMSASRLESR